MLLRLISLAPIAVAALGCGMPLWNPRVLPPVPRLSADIAVPGDTSEYGVLRWTVEWLAEHMADGAQVLFMRDSTHGLGLWAADYLLASDTTMVEPWTGRPLRKGKLAHLDPGLLRDFRDRNRQPVRLVSDSLGGNGKIVLLGDSIVEADWRPLYERHPKASVVFVVSRAGFNADRTRVLVSYSARCAPMMCGHAGYLLLARAPGRRWVRWTDWTALWYEGGAQPLTRLEAGRRGQAR